MGAGETVAQGTSPDVPRESQQLLLLKNGQIIEGNVTQKFDNVLLTTSDGSRLVFQKDEVETVCDSPAEAYWHKAAQTKATDLEGQKRLFHWCLSQQLPQFAENQIDIISMMDIKASDLEYLHRQLTVALDQTSESDDEQMELPDVRRDMQVQSSTPSRKSTDTASPVEDSLAFIRPLPAFKAVTLPPKMEPSIANVTPPSPPNLNAKRPDAEFAQVGFNEAVTTDRMSIFESTEESEQATVSVEELDRLTDSLPKPAVAMFKRKIEPLLTRSCFAGGCHQDNDLTMPLVRVGTGQLIPRRLSQRNLYSIIKFADPNEPLASPLLTAAMTSHGGLPDPIIEPSSKQFENLATWLIMISNKPNSIHQMPEPDLATRPDAAAAASPTLLEKREPVLPGEALPAKDFEDTGKINPHDPDIFNRQFRTSTDGG